MLKHSITLDGRASISLSWLMHQRRTNQRPVLASRFAGFLGADPNKMRETDPTAVLVEAANADALINALGSAPLPPVHQPQQLVKLDDRLVSIHAGEMVLNVLLNYSGLKQVQTLKRKVLHLEQASQDLGLRPLGGARAVVGDGTGVLIGIVDSGFDLSHPMFLRWGWQSKSRALARPDNRQTPGVLHRAVAPAVVRRRLSGSR